MGDMSDAYRQLSGRLPPHMSPHMSPHIRPMVPCSAEACPSPGHAVGVAPAAGCRIHRAAVQWASLVIFFISALLHELIVSIPFRNFRLLAFAGMMAQVHPALAMAIPGCFPYRGQRPREPARIRPASS